MKLDGARVWLTGASSGIGEALVAGLVSAGAHLAISARRADRLDEIVSARRRPDRRLLAIPADVTDREALRSAAARIASDFGAIDLAVFNAGIGRRLRVDAFDADDFVSVMTTNVFGVIYGIEAVLPGMLARRSGRIAAVASLAGYRSVPTLAGYGTSKAAVIHALECLRYDLRPHGIGVTIINPGYVRTPMTAENTYRMPFLIDADRAAAIIIRGLQRDRKEIHFPARLSWLLKFLRILPYPIYERLITAVVKR